MKLKKFLIALITQIIVIIIDVYLIAQGGPIGDLFENFVYSIIQFLDKYSTELSWIFECLMISFPLDAVLIAIAIYIITIYKFKINYFYWLIFIPINCVLLLVLSFIMNWFPVLVISTPIVCLFLSAIATIIVFIIRKVQALKSKRKLNHEKDI